MRLSQPQSSLSALLLLACSNFVTAIPFLNSELHNVHYSFLEGRDCALYCGLGGRYCCDAGQGCFTNAQSVAYCSSTVGNVNVAVATQGFAVYTTTWTETGLVTRTSTVSSYYAAPVPTQAFIAAPPVLCTVAGQNSCGPICCASNQYCASAGQCAELVSSWSYVAPVATAPGFSAPLRPTSGGVVVVATATRTQPFIPPATASGSTLPVAITATTSGGLSPGAIAGIVIGVLAAILLLLLLCFCCIAKAGLDGLLGLFGIGGRRRRRDRVIREETVEVHSRRGSGRGSQGARYYDRPSAVVESRRKKTSGMGGMGAVGAGLLGLAAVLGLKRKHDRNSKPPGSRYTGSAVTYSTTDSSQSSSSSDQRSRRP